MSVSKPRVPLTLRMRPRGSLRAGKVQSPAHVSRSTLPAKSRPWLLSWNCMPRLWELWARPSRSPTAAPRNEVAPPTTHAAALLISHNVTPSTSQISQSGRGACFKHRGSQTARQGQWIGAIYLPKKLLFTLNKMYGTRQGIGRYKNNVTYYSYRSFCRKLTSSCYSSFSKKSN